MESTLAKNFPWTAGLARLIWPEGASRRKRWVVVAAVILLLVALHTSWTAIASARLNRVTQRVGNRWASMALSSLAPPEVEDRDNAARPVRAAGELLELPEPVVGRRVAVRAYGSFEAKELRPGEHESVRVTIADNDLTLRVLDEAIDRPSSNWGVRYAQGVSAEIPDLGRILDLAKLNAAAGRLALRDGRTDELLRAVRRGVAIERSLSREPLTIIQLVAASVQRYHVALLREWLDRGDVDPAGLTSLADLWSDRRSGSALEAALANEAKGMVAVMQANPSAAVEHLGPVLRPVVIDNLRAYLERMESVAVCATQPRHERDPSCSDRRDVDAFGPYHFLARIMVLDFAATFERIDVADARAALTLVAIALERHRLRYDGYPESLAALAPEWLESVPADPLTGGSFEYGRTAAGYRLTTGAPVDELFTNSPRHDPVLSWTVER
jgi:hypothetical protein